MANTKKNGGLDMRYSSNKKSVRKNRTWGLIIIIISVILVMILG